MVETYFEGTRFLMLRAREQKFCHFDHDDADGGAVYKVVHPEYMEWLEADNPTLRKRVEELEALQEASIEFYCGVIDKAEWRIAIRNSRKGQELTALAAEEA